MKLILTGKIKAFLISLPFIIYFLYKIFLEDHSEHNGVFAETRDGKTYLSIDKIKEGCEKVEVDGVPWKIPLGYFAEVYPGPHILVCKGIHDIKLEINIPDEVIFRIKRWEE